MLWQLEHLHIISRLIDDVDMATGIHGNAIRFFEESVGKTFFAQGP